MSGNTTQLYRILALSMLLLVHIYRPYYVYGL